MSLNDWGSVGLFLEQDWQLVNILLSILHSNLRLSKSGRSTNEKILAVSLVGNQGPSTEKSSPFVQLVFRLTASWRSVSFIHYASTKHKRKYFYKPRSTPNVKFICVYDKPECDVSILNQLDIEDLQNSSLHLYIHRQILLTFFGQSYSFEILIFVGSRSDLWFNMI